MAKAIRIAMTKIRCLIETNEVGADQPYVIVVGADLTKTPPNVEATLSGPWEDMDKGEARTLLPLESLAAQPPQVAVFLQSLGLVQTPFWSLDNKTGKNIKKPEDVIFIVTVMENDDGDPKVARELAKTAAVASLASSMGMDRAERVQKLIQDINHALKMPTGFPNFDDRIDTKELKFTAKELSAADKGSVAKGLIFTGDGGQYRLRFETSLA